MRFLAISISIVLLVSACGEHRTVSERLEPRRKILIENIEYPRAGIKTEVRASINPPYAGSQVYYVDIEWSVAGHGDHVVERRMFLDGRQFGDGGIPDELSVEGSVMKRTVRHGLQWGMNYRCEFVLYVQDGDETKDIVLRELRIDLTKPPPRKGG